MQAAQDIYQDHLDVVSKLQWQRAFDDVCAHMHFPKRIETADTVATMQTAQEMRQSLAAFHASMVRLGAQAYHRVCLSAAFEPADSDRIIGRHRTYIMRGGQYVVDPYEAEMELVKIEDRWFSSSIRSDLHNVACTVISPEHHRKTGAGGNR